MHRLKATAIFFVPSVTWKDCRVCRFQMVTVMIINIILTVTTCHNHHLSSDQLQWRLMFFHCAKSPPILQWGQEKLRNIGPEPSWGESLQEAQLGWFCWGWLCCREWAQTKCSFVGMLFFLHHPFDHLMWGNYNSILLTFVLSLCVDDLNISDTGSTTEIL